MTTRAKRVLWLLNHRTLMKTEIPILLAMGYEVFTPKITPTDSDFRSGAINHALDSSLTIPDDVLAKLNETNFYTEEWSDKIVGYMNQYFGAVFVMPMDIPVKEGLQKFKGAVLLRAFGLEVPKTYAKVLAFYHRKDVFEWIYAVRDRFWFASGYQQLSEVEPQLLADRDVFLPIAMPSAFEQHRDTWTGGLKQILFVCPNILTNPYYAKVYEDFKRDFGDFPHVIVGAQLGTVDDPHVRGFVSDAEFVELLQRSDVMYYHSREPRHVHYTPVEGAEVGTPVVRYKENLLARMVDGDAAGAVDTVAEAREKIGALLNGDQSAVRQIRKDQLILRRIFSEAYCLEVWKKSFAESGVLAFLQQLEKQELVESVVWNPASYERVPRMHLLPKGTVISTDDTVGDGIDFTNEAYPSFVEHVEGVFVVGDWGSWSDGDAIEIKVSTPVKGMFDLVLTGGAYGKNIGEKIEIQVGRVRKHISFSNVPWEPVTVTLPFFLFDPVQTIKIHVPHPTPVAGMQRRIGVGLSRVAIRSVQNPDGDWFAWR
jgi:hypothetical protein